MRFQSQTSVFEFLRRSVYIRELILHPLLVRLTLPSVAGHFCQHIDVGEVKCVRRSVLARQNFFYMAVRTLDIMSIHIFLLQSVAMGQ